MRSNQKTKVHLLGAGKRMPTSTVPAYSAHLDMLRGLAALVVVVGHGKFVLADLHRSAAPAVLSTQGTAVPVAVHVSAMSPAHEAVVVFFALSGLLVGGSVLKEQVKQRSFRWGRYMSKRLTRLLTVLIPALVIGGLCDLASRYILSHGYTPGGRFAELAGSHQGVGVLLGNLCFLQFLDTTHVLTLGSNFALWSLAYEFWYYVFFPAALAVIVLPGLAKRIGCAVLACAVAGLLWGDPIAIFPVWLFGALITQLPRIIPERAQVPALLTSLAQMLAMMAVLWRKPLPSMAANNLMLGVSCCIFLWVALHRRAPVTNKLYQGVAEHLSRVSYTMYLFHLPFLVLIGSLLAQRYPHGVPHEAQFVLLLTASAYLYSQAMYRLFEARTDALRKGLGRSRNSNTPAPELVPAAGIGS